MTSVPAVVLSAPPPRQTHRSKLVRQWTGRISGRSGTPVNELADASAPSHSWVGIHVFADCGNRTLANVCADLTMRAVPRDIHVGGDIISGPSAFGRSGWRRGLVRSWCGRAAPPGVVGPPELDESPDWRRRQEAAGGRRTFADGQVWPMPVGRVDRVRGSNGSARGARIGLAMIVRDESAVIDRCLTSVRPCIDAWTVIDTGSTDDTPTRVQRALGDVPGRLLHRPWRNFGANRTELLAEAFGTADYLLLLDADMTVAVDAGALESLTADAYFVPVVGAMTYWMPYLIKNLPGWRFEGVTHEYLTRDGPYSHERLPGLRIQHHADGGHRAEKFVRDQKLLLAEVREHPDNARAVFYLAQTHRDLGDVEAAIRWYRRRADMGGWDEEVFYARYQVGCLEAERDWARAVEALIAAWDFRPRRVEPLYQLAVGWRQRGQLNAAHWATSRGVVLPVPDDLLFVETWMYRWGVPFEHSIAAYYQGAWAESLLYCDQVLADAEMPEPWRSHAVQNRELCRRALAAARA